MMFSFFKKKPKTCRKPGNSLTFLLTSATVFSVSLSVTTVALGPLTEQKSQNVVQIQGLEQVANNHLDLVEQHVRQNPEIFLHPTSYGGTFTPSDFPQAFALNTATYSNIPPLLRTPTGLGSVVVAGSSVDVQSEMKWSVAMGGIDSIVRFVDQPNTLLLTVTVQAGGTSRVIHRRVTFNPNAQTTDPTKIDGSMTGFAAPYAPGEPTDYEISSLTSSHVQIGPRRICRIQDGGLASGALPCTGVYPADLHLLDSYYEPIYNHTSPTESFLFLDMGTKELKLDYHSPSNSIQVAKASVPIFATKDDVAVAIVRPQKRLAGAYTPDHNVYRAAAFVKSGDSLQWAGFRWGENFANALDSFWEGQPIGTFADVFAGAPAGKLNNLMAPIPRKITSFTYDKATQLVVAVDKNNRQVLWRKVTFGPSFNDQPALGAIGVSDLPIANSQAFRLNDPVTDEGTGGPYATYEFGKPLVSADGKIILVPTLVNTPTQTAPYDQPYVALYAVNTQNLDISDYNNATVGSNFSNIAPIMEFNNTAATATTLTGSRITSLSDLHTWYNPHTNKFYWVVKGTSISSEFVHEWDPTTWANGDTTGVSAPAAAGNWYAARGMPELVNMVYATNFPRSDDQTGSYAGKYYTVRRINKDPGAAGPTSLWAGGTGKPQIVFNPVAQEFYFRYQGVSDNTIHAINLAKGWRQIYSEAVSFQPGPTIAVDPKTGALYFATKNNNLKVYSPRRGVENVTVSPSFSDGSGDGNMFYSPVYERVFYLDRPISISAATPNKLYVLRPFNTGAPSSVVSSVINGGGLTVGGFTSTGAGYSTIYNYSSPIGP